MLCPAQVVLESDAEVALFASTVSSCSSKSIVGCCAGGLLSWWEMTVTVFSTFTSRYQSFSHLPAEETASWSCCLLVCREGVDVMRAVSSANWLQVLLVFVQAWGRSMV